MHADGGWGGSPMTDSEASPRTRTCCLSGEAHDHAQAHAHRGEALRLQPLRQDLPPETAPRHALQTLS